MVAQLRFIVGDFGEGELAVLVIGDGFVHIFTRQGEAELTFCQVTTAQRLGAAELYLAFRFVLVFEGNSAVFFTVHGVGYAQRAVAVVRNMHDNSINFFIISHAAQATLYFASLVDELANCGKGYFIKAHAAIGCIGFCLHDARCCILQLEAEFPSYHLTAG